MSIHRQLVSGILNISHSDLLEKYLGCPVLQQCLNRTAFHEIINKATAKLEGWKANYLSKVGRTVQIQSHLESLLAHTMQCFQLPNAITSQLDRINRDFLWEKSNIEKGLHLIA